MKYLYIYNYKDEYKDLCHLELSYLFDESINDRHIISSKNIDIELSCFIKHKISLENQNTNFNILLDEIRGNEAEDFIINFIQTYKQDKVVKENRNKICKEIGLTFTNYANFDNPSNIYAVTIIDNIYYFGKYECNDKSFKLRNDKPYSYSNSLDIIVSKTSLNLVTRNDLSKSIIDPCCGVGTVVIEGKYQGYNIIGNDINYKVVESANKNLDYFKLEQVCSVKDIRDENQVYDCLIIDLPYGLFSLTSDEYTTELLINCKRIAKDIVVIAAKDISNILAEVRLDIIDSVKIKKQMNRDFSRYLYVVK